MRGTTVTDDDRGQAYTLEGFIGAMVVLMALLFALQSVVITPTTGGLADRSVQTQLQQEAQDALVIASEGDGENLSLSETARYWNHTAEDEGTNEVVGRYHNATQADDTYSADGFASEGFLLGQILEERFADDGWSYNVQLVHEGDDGIEEEDLVYQGSPPSDAVTASYAVTLYDDDELTAPIDGDDRPTLDNGDHNYPISGDADGPVYDVVEVRLVIW